MSKCHTFFSTNPRVLQCSEERFIRLRNVQDELHTALVVCETKTFAKDTRDFSHHGCALEIGPVTRTVLSLNSKHVWTTTLTIGVPRRMHLDLFKQQTTGVGAPLTSNTMTLPTLLKDQKALFQPFWTLSQRLRSSFPRRQELTEFMRLLCVTVSSVRMPQSCFAKPLFPYLQVFGHAQN